MPRRETPLSKRLTLRTERLAPLTDDELRVAAGVAAGEMTGHLRCVLSLERWCVTNVCTHVGCLDMTGTCTVA